MTDTVVSKKTIGQFFDELQFKLKIIERHKQQTDRYLASDFSVFSYIWCDENKLSDIIANLLKPNGTHGQGNKYLLAYLEMLFNFSDKNPVLQNKIHEFKSLVESKSNQIKIIREKSTDYIERSQRRMDIVIDFGAGYGLMIENKPWTIDQNEQLKHYYQDMKLRFKETVILVYLSGNGTPPSLDSLSKSLTLEITENGEYLETNFPQHITNWLERCLLTTEADKMRWFLRDFKDYIETNFSLSTATNLEL
jgi:hypothetical protein